MPLQKIIKKIAYHKKYWQNGAIPFLVISGVFIYLLKITWLKWGDLIIDTGTELYLPLEILSGKTLYRDIYYYHGPFGPYLNALLYKLFGIHLHSLILSGTIAAAAATFLVYKIARIFLNTFFSTFTSLTFLVVFAFGQYVYLGNYNFILPFSYGATYSIVFSLSALYFFNSLIRKDNLRLRYYVSLFITLTLLSKIEVGAGLIFSILAALILHRVKLRKPFIIKNLFRDMFFYAFIPLSLSGTVYFLLLGGLNVNNSFLEPFLFNTDFLNNAFARFVFGLDNLPLNLRIFIFSLSNYLLLIVLFALGAFFLSLLDRTRSFLLRRLSKAIAAVFIISLGMAFTARFFFYDWQYRPLPVLLLAAIIISLFGSFKAKTPGAAKEAVILFCISAFSFILVYRMLLFSRAAHYGFYLLVPGMIVYHIFFLKLLPRWIKAKNNRGFFGAAFLCVFAVFAAEHWGISSYCYKNRTHETSTPRGTIYTFNVSRENNTGLLIDYIIKNTPEHSSLAVFPEGVIVNFLSQRRNPLRLHCYIPSNLIKRGITEELITGIEREKIDYIVINQRNCIEFGYPVFGRDYGRPLWEYIKQNYLLLKTFGPFPYTTDEFGIALFKRKKGI